jgi:nucleoside-diphosphate-sugar epimerase
MTEKTVLILGGSGYLGQHLARRISADYSFRVTLGDVVQPPGINPAYVYLDIFDKTILDAQISSHEIIVNCTGQITQPIHACMKINTEGMANILDAVHKHDRKLFQISTVAVYGTCDFADESSLINPESPYSASKAFAEFMLQKMPGLNYSILRLSNIYGENQTKGLFSYLFRSYFSDRELDFDNNGSLLRHYVHIDDCTESIFLTVKQNLSGIFNLPAPEQYTLLEIIGMIETIKSMKFNSHFEPRVPIENIQKISYQAFSQSCNFRPTQSVRSFITHYFPDI